MTVAGNAGQDVGVKKSHTVEVAREELSGGIQFKTVVGDEGAGTCPSAGAANRAMTNASCVKATDTRRDRLRMNAAPLCKIPPQP